MTGTLGGITKDELREMLVEFEKETEHRHNEWTIDKKVPISIVAAILAQTFAFGWYASTLDGRLGVLERASPATLLEFSKLEEAREKSALVLQHHTDQLEQVLVILRRVEARQARDVETPPPPTAPARPIDP